MPAEESGIEKNAESERLRLDIIECRKNILDNHPGRDIHCQTLPVHLPWCGDLHVSNKPLMSVTLPASKFLWLNLGMCRSSDIKEGVRELPKRYTI